MRIAKSDFEHTTTHENGTTQITESPQPFPIKNYAIYKSWLKSKKIKMLFMHATAICPRDDVSEGQAMHDLEWTDNQLAYGSFDSRRNEIIRDVENGSLNMIVSGHSHRNVIMKVHNEHPNKAKVLASGEGFGSIEQSPENLIMVTSSGGPLPKYYPGGPLICACPNEYAKGWDYENNRIGKSKLYRYNGKSKKLMPTTECTKCGMPASDMVQKKVKRHKPGGNLLTFRTGKKSKKKIVKIESFFASDELCKPRVGVMCDENKVFTQSMKLEKIDSYDDYNFWEREVPINIVSRYPFKRYGYMDLPKTKVEYVTFLKEIKDGEIMGLRAEKPHPVIDGKIPGNQVKMRQEIGKEEFNGLKWSAESDDDYAFARYHYGIEKWDREIKMHKEYHTTGYESDTFNPESRDSFKNLVIIFKRKPDLNKRIEICGY